MSIASNHRKDQTSDILATLITAADGEGDISLQEVLKMLGARAFGLAILIFSLPNSLPIPSPPGFSAVTGFPIVIFGFQMLLGRKSLWLPARIRRYRFSRAKLTSFLTKALPYIRKVERLLHPRLTFMGSKGAEHVLGLVILLLSVLLAMPIPLGNFLPGLAISVIALGMLERDGLVMIAGAIGGMVGMVVILGFYGALAEFLYNAVMNFF
jgi:hypothetical protein